MGSPDVLARAEAFLQANGRLLERRVFAALLRGGSRESALAVVRTYQNDDGGFGHALLPELRAPESSPFATAFALRVLDLLDACEPVLLEGVFKYLTAIPPALNPTAAVAAILLKHGVVHPWVDAASDYCWRAIAIYDEPPAGSGGEPPCFETLAPVLEFLGHADAETAPVPDSAVLRSRIESLILEWDLVRFDPHDAVGPTPLDWAPEPSSPGRRLFTPQQIERHLEALRSLQQADGGWPAPRSAPSPAARLERRGWRTLVAVRTLRAYAVL